MSMTTSLLRRADEAMLDKFKTLVLVSEFGKHKIPVIYGSKEKAVAYAFEKADENLNDIAAFAKTIKLPLLALEREDFNYEGLDLIIGYKLRAYSLYQEDMNQIIEQVIALFSDKTKPYKLRNGEKVDNETNKSFRVCHWEFYLTLTGLGIGEKTDG